MSSAQSAASTTGGGPELVTKYVVWHSIANQSTEIVIYVQSNTGYSQQNLSYDQAAFLIDILRSEKPLWYNPSQRSLQTGYEPPGEAE